MDDSYKCRVRNAIHNFTKREERKSSGPSRKNQKPEKEVEKLCLEYMRALKWDVNIFEAKATFDPKRGVYRQQSMKSGIADCMGSLPDGIECAIEFKAPGKLYTFAYPRNEKQQIFIQRKIMSNCFAVVVDSVERLDTIYKRWREHRDANDLDFARMYLLSMIPAAKPKKDRGGLFD